jgi:endoglucanase
MVAAHMDEVGMMVSGYDDAGYLRFKPVGGISKRALAGSRVWLGADKIPGLIGTPPVHLLSQKEQGQEPKIKDLRIDIGASSKGQAQERIRLGEQATFATHMHRQDRVIWAKALDDRLGVAMLIELVLDPPPEIDLLAAFTVQEEIGARGAATAAYRLNPDLALAIDCTPARDFPTWDREENPSYNARIGRGPAIYITDGRMIADRRWTQHLIATAEAHQICYQIRQPGRGGTDSSAMHLSRGGIPSASLSVPGRHLHGPAGLIDTGDWRACMRLLYAALSELASSSLWPTSQIDSTQGGTEP